MTKVAILPVPSEQGVISFHAISGGKQSFGKTAGEALDALTVQLSEKETSTLIILQSLLPDRFFNKAQQERLTELMRRWRSARDKGEELPENEQSELETLIETELSASADRTKDLTDELKQ